MFENMYHISFIGASHAPFLKQKNTCYFIKESSPVWTLLGLPFQEAHFWYLLFFLQCTVWEKWPYWHLTCAYRKICNVISGTIFAGVGRLHIFSFSRFFNWCMSFLWPSKRFVTMEIILSQPQCFSYKMRLEKDVLDSNSGMWQQN
jgi:hypothetical protein